LGSKPSLLRRKEDAPTLMDVLLARTPLGRLRELTPLGAGHAAPTLKYVVPF
ncbi:MAG: hypothetical protein GX539_02820, partial [Candidatus Cloacimonetes bacterium]|nr:hypothetical protein [Candidatus Cloacimonadota bacterium]